MRLKNISKSFDNPTATFESSQAFSFLDSANSEREAILACDEVSLDFEAGKVYCLLGNNGAGKSTLVKIIAGILRPDSGEIELGGISYSAVTPEKAKQLKISMVHQGFSLVEQLTVLENLQLANQPLGKASLLKNPRQQFGDYSSQAFFDGLAASGKDGAEDNAKYDVKDSTKDDVMDDVKDSGEDNAKYDVIRDMPNSGKNNLLGDLFSDLLSKPNLRSRVSGLDIASRQQLEILKALHPLPAVLILDEPTAFLPSDLVEGLKVLIKKLAAEHNCTVIFISHDLDEVKDIADSIVVMEEGRVVEEATSLAQVKYSRAETRQTLASSVSETESPVLCFENFKLDEFGASGAPTNFWQNTKSHGPLNLELLPGEIVAITGEQNLGNSSSRLMEIFLGTKSVGKSKRKKKRNKGYSGKILIANPFMKDNSFTKGSLFRKSKAKKNKFKASKSEKSGELLELFPNIFGAIHLVGIALLPKDTSTASIPDMTVAENMFLFEPVTSWGIRKHSTMRKATLKLMDEYDISPRNPRLKMTELSGGNQRRALLARELSANPNVLIIEGLTEGLDINAADDMVWSIQRAAAKGTAVLMLTNDEDLTKYAHRKIAI